MARSEAFQPVQSLERAISILETVATRAQGVSLKELAEAVDLHPSTVYRLAATFAEHGYVEKNPENGHYRLGLKVMELASVLMGSMELRTEAQPVICRLVEETRETAHLAIMDNGQAVYIDKREPMDIMKMYSQIGKRSPAHCTGVGKVLLAFEPDEQIEATLKKWGLKRYTATTITEPEKLWEEVRTIRSRGYAIDDGEHEPFLRCVAVPIRDYRGTVVAALSVTVPDSKFTTEYKARLIDLVQGAGAAISQRIGYVDRAEKEF
ncbi:pectin degradation repressor protein KdgR [Peptococcaceae bacterium CEB3]|nr:pectin degradation repressor protein KdgR [Peptococcaceae bacterium CEB3]